MMFIARCSVLLGLQHQFSKRGQYVNTSYTNMLRLVCTKSMNKYALILDLTTHTHTFSNDCVQVNERMCCLFIWLQFVFALSLDGCLFFEYFYLPHNCIFKLKLPNMRCAHNTYATAATAFGIETICVCVCVRVCIIILSVSHA